MRIQFEKKTGSSNTGQCPARYRAPGGYAIQGKKRGASGSVAVNIDVLDTIDGFDISRCGGAVEHGEPGWYIVNGSPIADSDDAWADVRDLADDETIVYVSAEYFGLVA